MIRHFDCQPTEWERNATALVFDWDEETGEITGPSADVILATFKEGYADTHPYPSGHELTSTKNKTDLAVVVGWAHQLPPELADYYPECEDVDPNVYDLEGNVVGQVDF
jgi:hypothetical protein